MRTCSRRRAWRRSSGVPVGIYRPSLILSKTDRELLVLLAQLALTSQGWESNVSPEVVALSPREAAHLLDLLEQFANSKLFLEGAYFTEGVANGEAHTNDRLREIYFSWVVRRGGTRVASSQKWREFVLRAGFNSSSEAWMWPRGIRRSPLRPMPVDHFLRMEKRLLATAEVHPRVASLVLEFVQRSLPRLESLRERRATVRPGSVRLLADELRFGAAASSRRTRKRAHEPAAGRCDHDDCHGHISAIFDQGLVGRRGALKPGSNCSRRPRR